MWAAFVAALIGAAPWTSIDRALWLVPTASTITAALSLALARDRIDDTEP